MTNGLPSEQLVTIWFTDLTKARSAYFLQESYLSCLDAKERSRYEQLRTPALKERFLYGRVLLRTHLSHRLSCPPQHILLATGPLGRPEFADPHIPLSFNLSHSKDLIICAISTSRVGVDLENTTKKRNILGIAEHYFSVAERESLQSFASADRIRRFYVLWTLKEAYMKSLGESILSLKKDAAFAINNGRDIAFENDSAYSFMTFQPKRDYISSIAVQGAPPRDVLSMITIEEVIPLVSRNPRQVQLLGATVLSVKQVTSGESR